MSETAAAVPAVSSSSLSPPQAAHPLLSHHADLIRKSSISNEVAAARGYYSLPSSTAQTELRKIGFNASQAKLVPCMVIPIWDVSGKVAIYQIRPDHPRMTADRRVQREKKYEIPAGAFSCLDVPPSLREKLRDPAVPLWITEGARKVDAACSAGLCCIGVLGVWNWRGMNDHGGKTALPDWDFVALENRTVYIAFDSDATKKDSVRLAVKRLAAFLGMKKAKVMIVQIPDVEGFEKTGLDDYLASGATVESLLAAAVPAGEAVDPDSDDADSVHKIAEELLTTFHFARDLGNKLYIFNKGVYDDRGDMQLEYLVKKFYKDHKISKNWKATRAEEVGLYIRADTRFLWEHPPHNKVNLLNGIFDLETGKLEDHNHNFLAITQIPVNYNPEATCPFWEQFVADIFPEDALGLAWEIAAWLMVPITWIHKAILLVGEGGNGKSTFLTGIKHFLGRKNVSAASLQRLEDNVFSTSALIGKLANICPDLPSTHLESTSVFKSLTGGDEVQTERKYFSEFMHLFFARLIFSANRPPRCKDSTDGFFDRWLVIPFNRSFRGRPGEVSRRVLDNKLSDPSELSGLLNKAIAAYPKVRDQGLSTPQSTIEANTTFRQMTDPLNMWISSSLIRHAAAFVVKDDLLNEFNRYAIEKGLSYQTAKAMTMALRRWDSGIREVQRTIGGKRKWCWQGVGLKDNPNPDMPSEDSREAGQDGFGPAPELPFWEEDGNE